MEYLVWYISPEFEFLGVYDPFYRILLQQATVSAHSGFVYDVPLLGKRWTIYRYLPDSLGTICIAFLCVWTLFFFALPCIRRYKYVNRMKRISLIKAVVNDNSCDEDAESGNNTLILESKEVEDTNAIVLDDCVESTSKKSLE